MWTAAGRSSALVLALASGLGAQQMHVINPSNSGVPGELIHRVVWAPEGDLWVAARQPFWREAGIGVYDLDAETWSVWTNWETPIPSEFINDIEFDAAGVAWIATDQGLVRWDRSTWTVYDPSNTPMQLPKVRDVAIAPDGRIWVNNSDFNAGGDAIWEFDGVAGWTPYRVPDQLPWAAPWTDLSHVYVARDGHVWVAHDTLPGVAEYDGVSWTLRGESLGVLDEMAEDQFGNLWINANGVGGAYAFYRWDGTRFTTYPFSSPTTLVADPEDGTVYFGNWNGQVLRTRDGGQTIEPYLSGLNQVFDIAPDPAGPDVWIGTIGAVGHFRDDGSWVRDFNTWNSGFPDYFIDSVIADNQGYLWVTSGEAGLSRFDGLRWRNWGAHNVGSEPYPFAGNEPMGAAFRDSTGTYWFGGNGIARWQENTGQFTGFWNWQNNPGMGVTLFTFFAEDAAGNVFAAAEYGTIYRFDVGSSLWVREPVSVYAASGLPGMQADGVGDVWVAGWFDLHHWNGSAWSKVTLPDPNYFFDLGGINAMDIGPDGTFWLGTNEGLVSWDGTTFVLYDQTTVPLPGPMVTGVDVFDDGRLGLCARGSGGSQPSGVSIVSGDVTNAGDWTSYLYGSSPLPHWQIGRCAFDPQGNLWASAISEGCAIIDGGLWTTLGGTLGGTAGPPNLIATGTLRAGDPVTMTFTDARPGTTALAVVGFSELSAPFQGGTLVPFPDIVMPGFVTGADGRRSLTATWPPGIPAGTSYYYQFWILDPMGPEGLAATNAVQSRQP